MVSHTKSVKSYEVFWTQFDWTGNLCLRLITRTATPPLVKMNVLPLPLSLRASPGCSFPVFVWEASLSLGGLIEIEDVSVTLPLSFQKIFFLGDTGCRPDQEFRPEKWPFKKIVTKALKEKPDLMIHLGDYIYRHFKAQEKCDPENIDWMEGDNWMGWEKEFFIPAADVLSTVPWVFIRGNQESNQCACEGWFRFFDGYPYPSKDLNYTPAYVISLDTVNLIVHDSSYLYPNKEMSWPNKQLTNLTFAPHRDTWLLTHRPLWGIVNNKALNNETSLIIMNEHSNLQPFLEPFPDSLTTIFSGHIHAFQAIKLASYPIQLFVMGNGGVSLEKAAPPRLLKDTHLENKKIEFAFSVIEFGYSIAEIKKNIWDLTAKNSEENLLYHGSCRYIKAY